MPEGDVPFAYGDTPKVGVGFSDKALLTVSVAGFTAMAVVVYCIIIARVKANDELEKGQDDSDLDYEDELLRSDVKTLNRAQRRARAKALMKRQRRADSHTGGGDENDNNQNEQRGQDPQQQHEDSDQPHLSRKERQKAAKAAEKKERQLLDGERQEEQRRAQEAAQEEKKKRLQLEAERAQEEKLRREQEQQEKQRKAFENWETFLASSDQEESISVKEWTEELKVSRIVSIEKLAERFNIDSDKVTKRIRDLVKAGRVTGVINQGTFICLTHEELLSIASTVKEQGEATYQDLTWQLKK